MSVIEFESALALRQNTRFAIVSEALFFALDDLSKIELKQIQKALTYKGRQDGSVRVALRQFEKDAGRLITLTYFVVVGRPDVHLDLVLIHQIKLDDMRPKSFLFCDEDWNP